MNRSSPLDREFPKRRATSTLLNGKCSLISWNIVWNQIQPQHVQRRIWGGGLSSPDPSTVLKPYKNANNALFQCLQIILAKPVPKLSYFAIKFSKVVSFWGLRPKTPGLPAAEGFASRPPLLPAAVGSAPDTLSAKRMKDTVHNIYHNYSLLHLII